MTDTATPRFTPRPEKELVPRTLLRGMVALTMSVLVLVTYARLTDRPLIATPPESAVTIQRQVLLDGDLSGAATVTAMDGALIADLTPEQGGFVSGVWRVILRERTKHRVSLEGPVTLIGHANGRISIHDPSTEWSADLMGFGADNARAFARLLAQQQGGQ